MYVDMLRCVVVDGPVGHTSVHCSRGTVARLRFTAAAGVRELRTHPVPVGSYNMVAHPRTLMKAKGKKASVASRVSKVFIARVSATMLLATTSAYMPLAHRSAAHFPSQLPLRPSRRQLQPLMMVPLPSEGNGDPDEPSSGIEAQARSMAAAFGGNSAAVLFTISQRVRERLITLGYSEAEIDALDPLRAAAIIQASPQKPKAKQDRFQLRFTCNVCETPNAHSISRHAYTKGTVIVTCPGCNSTHLIADHLNWIEDDFKTLEQYMAKRGTPVRNLVTGGAGVSAAAQAATLLDYDEDEPEDASQPVSRPIEGISDDQAARIREALQAAKRRQRPGS